MRTTQAKTKKTAQTAQTAQTKKTQSKARKATTKSKDPHGWEALFRSMKDPLTAEKIVRSDEYIHQWKVFVNDEENRIIWDAWRRVTDLNMEISTWELTKQMLMAGAAEITAALPPSKPTH
jgi:hypothetical protein